MTQAATKALRWPHRWRRAGRIPSPPRHHGDGRLCVAQGREVAGGAARSSILDPDIREISRAEERLHRACSATPRRCRRSWSRKCAGGSRRPDSSVPSPDGRSPYLRKFREGGQHELFVHYAARLARSASCSTATRLRRATTISGSAARGIRPITGCIPGARTQRLEYFPFACATGPVAPIST